MMKMLRYLGLAVFAVCIAAFASGCGGGGGGSAMEEEPPPVMECPQGQVGTYPDCTDPGPTDEQRIATARETIAGIVNQANTIEQAARSAVTAVEASADATVQQIDDARSQGTAARNALTDIVGASGVVATATTPAAAEGAVASANAALGRLRAARTAAEGIRSAVDAVANLREQQAETERLATNGSSLIRYLRNNENDLKTTLNTIEATDISVSDTFPSGYSASYPYYEDPNAERKVAGTHTVTAATLSSTSSVASKLTGPPTFRYGFDLKASGNNPTEFVNAYTNIERQTRTNNPNFDSQQAESESNPRYNFTNDPDYLLLGIWLNGTDLKAFAYGSQPINSSHTFCGAAESANTATLTRTCVEPTGTINLISAFVSVGKIVKATYRGDANGAYLAGGKASYFDADVELRAVFENPDGAAATGSIEGEITNISAGGKSISGNIQLQKEDLTDAIEGEMTGATAGVIGGESYSGTWKGQFFRMKASKTSKTGNVSGNTPERTTTTTYTLNAPGSVAGTFMATKQTAPVGDAAFIGVFGAHR